MLEGRLQVGTKPGVFVLSMESLIHYLLEAGI